MIEISNFLKLKAEEGVRILLKKNLDKYDLPDAKGFFVTADKEQSKQSILAKIRVDEKDYYICQKGI
ncbi:hypothetical protein K8R32_05420 [bacterium]|nr:hypothetical protein [bacterium]